MMRIVIIRRSAMESIIVSEFPFVRKVKLVVQPCACEASLALYHLQRTTTATPCHRLVDRNDI